MRVIAHQWQKGGGACALGQHTGKDGESARDNRVLACNFAKYLPIFKMFSLADSAINLS